MKNLDDETISKLQTLIEAMTADNGDPLTEVASELYNAGITWDMAIAAREKQEPSDFFCIFKNYYQHKTIEWFPICRSLNIELLVSLLTHEANKITEKGNIYNSSYYPFFIAGLERLINYHISTFINFPSIIVIFTSLFTSFKLSSVLDELDYNMAVFFTVSH